MKKYLITILFTVCLIFGQDYQIATISIGDTVSSVVTMSRTSKGLQTPTMFQTDTLSQADSLYIQVYNPIHQTYLTLEDTSGLPVLYQIEANRTYWFDSDYFRGVEKFRFFVSDTDSIAINYPVFKVD